MLSSAVTAKGQVTIPRKIRALLHIKMGDKISFKVEDDHAVLQKKINNIEAAFGLIKSTHSVSLNDMETAIRKGVNRDRH